jgi:hypothetical protein
VEHLGRGRAGRGVSGGDVALTTKLSCTPLVRSPSTS